VRRDGRLEAVRIDQFPRRLQRRRGEQAVDVVVAPAVVEAGGDRLHRHRAQPGTAQRMQQCAGNEGLADFGIGPGDEPGGLVWRVIRLHVLSHFLA
jgi:hypothetical protein